MNMFTFNGVTSNYHALRIANKTIYTGPERDQTFIAVPGRNGDVVIDNGRYKNVDISYQVWTTRLSHVAKGIKNWLCVSGYHELEDTYDANYFRYAAYAGALNIEESIRNIGQFTAMFNCKPFRYLKEGKNTTTITSSPGTIYNPEIFNSLPKVTIYASGDVTFRVGNNSYPITGIDTSITLDSELMSAYKGNVLQNYKIGFTEFPELKPGSNTIRWTGSVTKVEIVPRWRTL